MTQTQPKRTKRLFALAVFTALVFVVSAPFGLHYLSSSNPIVTEVKMEITQMDIESLRYVQQHTVETWRTSNYFVVFGIPSVDILERRLRRYAQRSTCWKYPGVATRRNNFTGEMLVVYVLARHPSNKYAFSAELQREAIEWQDVITLPMNEGRPNVSVKSKCMEVEVGMSRKTFLWYALALRLFPTAVYLVKADDDIFLRVPQYLADLHTLPRRGVYWGRMLLDRLTRGGRRLAFPYIGGYCSTTSRDVAESLVSYKPLEQLSMLSYSRRKVNSYLAHKMDHEDRMVGLALALMKYPIILVEEPLCRFHYVSEDEIPRHAMYYGPVTQNSVVVHHLTEAQYTQAKERFFENVSTPVSYSPVRPPEGFMGVRTVQFACL